MMITHMCFAHDLMIFCRAELSSTQAIMSILKSFEKVSGLHMNPNKSSNMVAGISQGAKDLAKAIVVRLLQLPTEYLGMPLVATHQISPYNVQVYWARSLILPKAVTGKLYQICTSFLWAGSEMTRKIHPVSEAVICRRKETSGLGITNIEEWNSAAICGLVYKLATKEDNLWVKWLWNNSIKSKNFWTMIIPKDNSWSWRNILSCRKQA
ncbi:hypothetical protein IFM89_026350 [Coptis chinensis]|uniref:Reverse transcriptase domain-containing protein n=1 Tax=Coptis chinensis TaxID=261450 RepID=A0A835HMR7_9MAGN|nr:hypothetical protein IFM89_026350 [Coptis chinensis]